MSLDPAAQAALDEVLGRDDPAILGIILTGSAARGMATERSDVDVYVVLTDEAEAGRDSIKTRAIDEIPKTLAEVEEVEPWGSEYYGYRWSFAYAQVLRDNTGGRITEAVRRQGVHTVEEQRRMLLNGDQLDGYLNMAYRALKSDRDGRPLERRLDAAESVHWWLDVVFTLEGRVRPYNKYLAWELREHPLSVVERECLAWDERHGGHDLHELVEGWGDELAVLRGG